MFLHGGWVQTVSAYQKCYYIKQYMEKCPLHAQNEHTVAIISSIQNEALSNKGANSCNKHVSVVTWNTFFM